MSRTAWAFIGVGMLMTFTVVMSIIGACYVTGVHNSRNTQDFRVTCVQAGKTYTHDKYGAPQCAKQP